MKWMKKRRNSNTFCRLHPPLPPSLCGGALRSDELEQEVLDSVQNLAGFPQGSIRVQLGRQEEELPVLHHGAQRQGLVELGHAHSAGLILPERRPAEPVRLRAFQPDQ